MHLSRVWGGGGGGLYDLGTLHINFVDLLT